MTKKRSKKDEYSRIRITHGITVDTDSGEKLLDKALRRPLRKANIYQMALDMLCGLWLETPPFMFIDDPETDEEVLIDGAHRCAAVVRAQKLLDNSTGDEGWIYHERGEDKVSIQVMKIGGLPKEMMLTLDRGIKRQPGDVLCSYHGMFPRKGNDSWAGDAIRMSRYAYAALEFYHDREWGVPDFAPDSISPYLLPGLDSLYGHGKEQMVVSLLEQIVRAAYTSNKVNRHEFKPKQMEEVICKAFQICMNSRYDRPHVLKKLKNCKAWPLILELWDLTKEKGNLK